MLSEKLFALPSFQRQYQALLKMSASDQIPSLERNEKREDLYSLIDWENIVSIASVLSFSENPTCISAALRIVEACLQEKNCSQSLKDACGFILENMTNQQGLTLAIRKNLLSKNYALSLPLPLQISRLSVLMQSHIYLNKQLLPVNKFQKQVVDKFLEYKSLSISAPTSAGKSFILGRLLLDVIFELRSKCVVYVVPSRALIAQVEKDLRDLISNNSISKVTITISSIPPRGPLSEDQTYIFVFTQERLHWFLCSNTSLPVDFIIVDEAQKIEDKGRGILLQETVERAVSLNPNVLLVFACPFTKNPEIFFNNFGTDKKYGIVDTNFISVNQNLYFLDQHIGKPRQYDVSLIAGQDHHKLGNVILDSDAKTDIKRLSSLALKLSNKKDSSLIYANGKAMAESIALSLAQSLPTISDNRSIDQLIDLVKKVIHPKYRLIKTLRKGVAFHYGNLPIIVRTEIERLFSQGNLKFLVCTSTLLEGVNTPTKNLFLLNPKKGNSDPLSNTDFWNLIGRAGRAGAEFCGNIFCINAKSWSTHYSLTPEPRIIESSLQKIVNDQSFELWLENNEKKEFFSDHESAFGYYYLKFAKNRSLPKIRNDQVLNKLIGVLEKQSQEIELPMSIFSKNFFISPLKQQALLDKFKKLSEQDFKKSIPPNPHDSNAYYRYLFILKLITNAFSLPLNEKQQTRWVTLALKWMKGFPLWKIIDGALKDTKDENKQATIIRKTMKAIEDEIRFQFLGYLTCYTDILRFYIAKSTNDDVPESISDVCLWLELGVSHPVQISLMQLGLSRSTAIELQGLVNPAAVSKEECIRELKNKLTFFRQSNLPEAMYQEIENILCVSGAAIERDKN